MHRTVLINSPLPKLLSAPNPSTLAANIKLSRSIPASASGVCKLSRPLTSKSSVPRIQEFSTTPKRPNMASNRAAWLVDAKVHPFEVKSAPLVDPVDDEVLIKNHAISINPIDGKLQRFAFYPLQYPTILGQDIAGEVVAVGPQATRFKPGDRVFANAPGFETKRSESMAFQEYTLLKSNLTAPIPDGISYESAVVLGLATSTAASGLFQESFLGLRLPTSSPPQDAETKKKEFLLVWGGASSVGSCAIQLAVAAGYSVVSTSSPKNFDYVRGLGAKAVFDYNSPTVVQDLVKATEGNTVVGAFDAVGGSGWELSAEFLAKTETENAGGVTRKFVATAARGQPDPVPHGVGMKQVYALSILKSGVAKSIYEDFLPEALKNGSFVPAPEPLIVGKGLEKIQEAVEVTNGGLSAKKAVVSL